MARIVSDLLLDLVIFDNTSTSELLARQITILLLSNGFAHNSVEDSRHEHFEAGDKGSERGFWGEVSASYGSRGDDREGFFFSPASRLLESG